jgi:hypothetical protein
MNGQVRLRSKDQAVKFDTHTFEHKPLRQGSALMCRKHHRWTQSIPYVYVYII